MCISTRGSSLMSFSWEKVRFGLLSKAWFKGGAAEGSLDDAAIDALIEERTQARADKNFQRADEIRDELAEQGILLEDGAGGTTWKRG